MKNKIAIVTLYDDINIGNKLQNYAVQSFFEELGYECRTIPHWEMAHDPLNMKTIKKNVCKLIGYPKKRSLKLRMEEKRKKAFTRFSNQYLKLTDMVKINSLPADLNNRFDYFVTGSDQVWHNWTNTAAEVNYFMLRFAKENQRLTISPSFGKNAIDQFAQEYKEGLAGFKVITCREESGVNLIQKLVNKEAYVLLDPTMLISEEHWVRLRKKPTISHTDKYILIYCLGKLDEKKQEYIQKISKENHLEIIDVYNVNFPQYYCTTPDEFLYYISNASMVFTDSFHACVFSILFKKDFIVFERDTSLISSMTSRLDTLLNRFDLIDRKMSLNKSVFGTDFSKVDDILREERERARDLYNKTFKILR